MKNRHARFRAFPYAFCAALLLLLPCLSVQAEEAAPAALNGYRVCIDAGHQGWNIDMSAPEPVGPGSSQTKPKATAGTTGTYTGVPEYQLNLDIALMLDTELQARGYETVLTRRDNDTAISNKERAELAGSSGCDISVRIHANGDDTHTMAGALTMAPSGANPYVGYLSEESARLSQCVIDAYCSAAGFANLGVTYADNMTGFNWCTIPMTIIEMGFMTNESDDNRMNDPAVRTLMVQGIADGIDDYFGIDRTAAAEGGNLWASAPAGEDLWGPEPPPEGTAPEGDPLAGEGMLAPPSGSGDSAFSANTSDERVSEVLQQVQAQLPQGNGTWSVYVCNLANDTSDCINNGPMQAASLIKLFIMGAVYERYDSLSAAYGADNLYNNLYSMITVSDNTAANTLVGYLGGGDTSAGMDVVNQFCQSHDYGSTSMGRLLLQSTEYGDNYTSAEDCGRFLKEEYQASAGLTDPSTLSHTADMFALLQQQTRRHKIPAQMPAGVSTANKTGELADVENDAAIIFNAPAADLVIVFLSENLQNPGSAQASIAGLARTIYSFFNE